MKSYDGCVQKGKSSVKSEGNSSFSVRFSSIPIPVQTKTIPQNLERVSMNLVRDNLCLQYQPINHEFRTARSQLPQTQ